MGQSLLAALFAPSTIAREQVSAEVHHVLFDLRPLRTPMSGVASYCANLIGALKAVSGPFEFHGLYCGTQTNNEVLRKLDRLPLPSVARVPHIALMLGLEFTPVLTPFLVKGRFDLVHETYFANAYSRSRARKVVTIHDVIPVDRPLYVNWRNRFFSRRNLRRQSREANHVISVSEYTKRKIVEQTGMDPDFITVIPCGVAPLVGDIDADYLCAAGLSGKRFMLFVGNVEFRKNIAVIAAGLIRLNSAHEDVQFVVAGHAKPESEPILAECREALGARFHHLGFVSEVQKGTLLRSAAALVLPSLYEGFGIPIVEAYQASCPVLIANNSSLTELSVDERQLFTADSPAELAACMSEVLEGAAWVARSVVRGLERAQDYSWQAVAQRTASVYERVLGY